jgi:uncharacterized protein
MAATMMWQEFAGPLDTLVESEPCTVRELKASDEKAVQDFLAARPMHTVFMASLIRDNGLVSQENRGTFYGCCNRYGELEGVALLGHATIIEARSENSLATFARLTRKCRNAHVIRGERKSINRFWQQYAGGGKQPRLVCRELMFVLAERPLPQPDLEDLRLANLDDLDKVVEVNASMAFIEAGRSPLERDPGGFRQRTARRIEQGRVWVWVRDNRLIFKADVVGDTPMVIYLEGVHVHPEERRKGYGLRGLKQVSANLLSQTDSICLTANSRNQQAVRFYARAGYQFHSHYESIYLR